MKKSINTVFTLILIIFTFSSCTQKNVYSEFIAQENDSWDRFKNVYFTIPIKETPVKYDFYLSLKVSPDIEVTSIPIYAIITMPNGGERMRELSVDIDKINLKVKKSDKKEFYETKTVLWKDVMIDEPGDTKIEIETIYPRVEIQGVQKIGIIVEKSK